MPNDIRKQKEVGVDLFGEPIMQNELLSHRFGVPPFSVINSMQGDWQMRKKKWRGIGIQSELGRDVKAIGMSEWLKKNGQPGDALLNDTSIFDPVLCEICYTWFCPPAGKILDPFAGGSVRGIVAGYLGYTYHGIDLRGEQIQANTAQAEEIKPQTMPMWVEGDSDVMLDQVADGQYDLVFSCPPYFDLEVYSQDPADLSAMQWAAFSEKYKSIARKAVAKLRPNSFACFVVAELRDQSTGFYRGFVKLTQDAFEEAGATFYNDIIFMQPIGTAAVRVGNYMKKRKVAKIHQNVMVFFKGDPKVIPTKFPLL
jgi:hypothetical protein